MRMNCAFNFMLYELNFNKKDITEKVYTPLIQHLVVYTNRKSKANSLRSKQPFYKTETLLLT